MQNDIDALIKKLKDTPRFESINILKSVTVYEYCGASYPLKLSVTIRQSGDVISFNRGRLVFHGKVYLFYVKAGQIACEGLDAETLSKLTEFIQMLTEHISKSNK